MDFHGELEAVGILVLEEGGILDRLIPAFLTGQAPSCPTEERWTEADIDVRDMPALQAANDTWYRMSVRSGLFSEIDRRFLLAHAVGDDGPSKWLQVQLLDQWDVMGEGTAGPLGSASFRPEFRMLSLDGSVLLCGTTGEDAVSIFVVKEPDRSRTFTRFAEWVITTDVPHPEDVVAVRRWLTTHGRHDV